MGWRRYILRTSQQKNELKVERFLFDYLRSVFARILLGEETLESDVKVKFRIIYTL